MKATSIFAAVLASVSVCKPKPSSTPCTVDSTVNLMGTDTNINDNLDAWILDDGQSMVM
ncbi:hypothetical protein SEUCBS140593_007975 [Sporothrix eucalyptigena]|uniref:Uncharacterized protein n=1 Tax=Sporothrix eucalyptigena TaxID=1812306 RepID=A0ABP0CHM1_9PEZI